MSVFFALVFLVLSGVLFYLNKRLKKLVGAKDAAVTAAKAAAEQSKRLCDAEVMRIREEAQALLDRQTEELRQESERVRQHCEAEAQRVYADAAALSAKISKEMDSLRKYETLRDAETEMRRILSEAMDEATSLRKDAQSLLESSQRAAAEERSKANQKAKDLLAQAESRLSSATRDAGRIIAEAEERAKQIAGDAYTALRSKEQLEQAVTAIRNVVEGYGDRYIVPTRSILDDLAADFGHMEAGEALRAAREHSRRMVEQGQAAKCDYVEANRRETAIRFVIDAFNGRADAILSRCRYDNRGTLEQEIRDACSLVNLNGLAFRGACILPAYLDARLAELKWAVVVQELRMREREEQQRIKEQAREEEKARREYERAMREAAKDEERLRAAMETARQHVEQATAEQKAKYELQLQELSEKLKQAEERNQRAMSMAQQTRRGHVYIISNIGSFGEDVYKIGLTRRLEPMDRIDELGDSSVPFEFDVHALIPSDDAPALETKLHKHFVEMQVNKVNHRKEFFQVDLKHIRQEIESFGLNPKWTMTAAAKEYRESQAITAAIKSDPVKRDAWIKRQLELEPLEVDSTEPLEDAGLKVSKQIEPSSD